MRETVKYIVALLIFGSNGVIASYVPLPSEEIVLMRTLIGSSALILVLPLSRSKLDGGALRPGSAQTALRRRCLGANWALLFEAYKLMSVSLATLLYYTAPVMVLLLSPLLLRERQSAPRVPGHGRGPCWAWCWPWACATRP